MSARLRSLNSATPPPKPEEPNPIYTRFLNGVLAPLWAAHERSPYLRIAARLEAERGLSRDERQARQLARLQAIVRHADATVPFYRERFAAAGFAPGDLKSLADLKKLPLLAKADIRERGRDLLSTAADLGPLMSRKTSGSTGVSLNFFNDDACAQWKRGVELYRNRWTGWRLGEYRAMVWGNPPAMDTFRARLRNDLLERGFYLDTLRMNDAMMDTFAAQVRTIRPTLMFGHAHSLYLFAQFWRARGLPSYRFKGIISTAMVLHDYERAEIEAVFETKIFNRYGCEEVSLIASECESHQGLHLNDDSLVVEVEPDHAAYGAHGFGPEGEGRVVVTDLWNRGMPFIRYVVGDMAVPTERVCACGRSYPLIERVAGRIADYLLTPDGDRVSGISLTENFATLIPGVVQVQIVQEKLDELNIRLVPAPEFNVDSETCLAGLVRDRFGDTMRYTIERVERILPEPSGKYRFAICKVEAPARSARRASAAAEQPADAAG